MCVLLSPYFSAHALLVGTWEKWKHYALIWLRVTETWVSASCVGQNIHKHVQTPNVVADKFLIFASGAHVWKQPKVAFYTWIDCRLSCCSLMDRSNCQEEVGFLAQFCLNPGMICLQWEHKWSNDPVRLGHLLDFNINYNWSTFNKVINY